MMEILRLKAEVSQSLADGVASCLVDIQNLNLKQIPSIDEGIKWAKYLRDNFGEINKENMDYTICMIAKSKEDMETILNSNIIDKNLKK